MIDCTRGSCQRHGRCMYFNWPRCPLLACADPAKRPDHPKEPKT